MPFERTAARIWRHLTREERLAAARDFWREPPEAMIGAALAGIIKARRLRPQVARSLTPEARAEALASMLDPGEALASTLLVALHLGERRAMLVTFLDALGLAHENGILKDDDGPPISTQAAQSAAHALLATVPVREVETYLNTLWLQDPDRWGVLEQSESWLGSMP
jgi:hypothetical protein